MRKCSVFPSGNISQFSIVSDPVSNIPIKFCSFIYVTSIHLILCWFLLLLTALYFYWMDVFKIILYISILWKYRVLWTLEYLLCAVTLIKISLRLKNVIIFSLVFGISRHIIKSSQNNNFVCYFSPLFLLYDLPH